MTESGPQGSQERDTDTYDVVVIGGGPAGENAAQYAIEGTGLTAVVVERELMGGECSYYACMPSKALLRPVQVADTAGDLPGVERPRLDVAELLARRDSWVSGYDDAGQVAWAEGIGVDVVRGAARLVGERTVAVTSSSGERTLTARRAVVLATGSDPVVPPEYATALPWGSRDATGVREIPERLAIIGGGVIACEAATWMAALGSQVTLLVRDERLLPRTEPFAGEAVLASLRAKGVTVHLATSVTEVSRPAAEDTGLGRVHGGEVTLRTDAGAEGSAAQQGDPAPGEIVADELLVAVGRRPALSTLGLDDVGLAADDVTGGRLPDWLLAVGDAAGEAPLTHWGKYRARVLAPAVAARPGQGPDAAPDAEGSGPAPFAPDPAEVPVPQVVFTDPEVASVGMTEQQARDAGFDVFTATVPTGHVAGVALLRDHPTGQSRLVFDRQRRTLVGATFVGPEVAEIVHAATVAIVGQVPVHVLRHAVPSYPTGSEVWLRLLEELPVELRAAP